MNAKELFEALHGVPAEALCDGVEYTKGNWGWLDRHVLNAPLPPHRAAALQRDSMCEWISLHSGDDVWPVLMHLGGETYWSIDDDEHYPTRLHALAAAVRFVAGQKEKA